MTPGLGDVLRDMALGSLWLTRQHLTRVQRSLSALEATLDPQSRSPQERMRMRPEPDPWLYELPAVPLPIAWQEELEAIIDVALNLSGTVRRPPRQLTADGERLKAEAVTLVERVLRERQP